jgi:hypothetical protein
VLPRTVGCVLAFGLGAFAQEPNVVVKLEGVRYPVIARQARIQGDVVFRVTPNGRELVSSANPILTPIADVNLGTWTLPPGASGGYLVTYHFEILEAGKTRVPIGNGFTRFFRRLAGAPTEKTFSKCYRWGAEADPPPRFETSDARPITIDVAVPALDRCAIVD